MRITRIELENVRRFRRPTVVADFDPGLNLFTGPNGSGKSSLIAAIRAAFFERYKTGSVSLRPIGDSSVSPRITITFETAGITHELTKQFHGVKRCSLQAGPRVLDGEEAEDHLAALLGYTYAGRGGSRAENWGIPGLLWIEQGCGHDLAQAVGHAKDRLQGALQSMVGAVASTGGDAVIQNLRGQLGVLVTGATQAPRGNYQAAKRELQELDDQALDLTGKVERFRSDVDKLGADDASVKQLQFAQPWADLEAKAAASKQQCDSYADIRGRLDEARRSIEAANKLSDLYSSQLDGLTAPEQELPSARDAVEAAKTDLAGSDGERLASNAAFTDAEVALQDVRAAVALARQSARRKELTETAQDLLDRVRRSTTQLKQAQEFSRARIEHQRTIAENAIPPSALANVLSLAAEIRDLGLQVNAVGTRIGYVIESGTDISIDGTSLDGSGSLVIDRPATLTASGFQLDLTPGGDDLSRLLETREATTAKLAAALARLGLPDVAAVEARAERFSAAAQADELLAVKASQAAPDGIEQLELAHAELETKHRCCADELAALSEPPPEDLELDLECELARERAAHDALELSRTCKADATTRHFVATSVVDRCDDALTRIRQRLEAPDRDDQLRTVRQGILDAKKQRTEAEMLISQLDEQLQGIDLKQLEQDAQRYTQSGKQERARFDTLCSTTMQLQANVRAVGGEGLEERLADVKLRREKVARRVTEYARQVDVLGYLLDQLESRRERVRQQLIDPLQKRIDHYLRMLMPERKLLVADTLAPAQLVNAVDSLTQGEFDMQSFGTREQLALICRLAYADLLKESGSPTLVILDDALVHTDDERLDGMKRLLFDAASRHQILMMTCHPDRWRDLGARTTAMADLVGA